YRRCSPLPIPNRAVKPARADGIAVTGVRVGRCLFIFNQQQALPCERKGFFCAFFSLILRKSTFYQRKCVRCVRCKDKSPPPITTILLITQKTKSKNKPFFHLHLYFFFIIYI